MTDAGADGPATRYAESAGIQIAYDDLGHGEPPLLLLPGWCTGRALFGGLRAACAARRRVLSLDWRGHGESGPARADFGRSDLVDDALAVVAASGAHQVVPVAVSHAGWMALELRQALGDRAPRLVLLDWIVLEPPRALLAALNGLQAPGYWEATRERLLAAWLGEATPPEVATAVRAEMSRHGFDMWARAAREIQWAYAGAGSPVRALSARGPFPPTLHLYAQPRDEPYLAIQRQFSRANPWFGVERLEAHSHFSALEAPAALAAAIERFVA